MTLREFVIETRKTAIYPGYGEGQASLNYLTIAIIGELGELANVYKKIMRGDFNDNQEKINALLSEELGGSLWYVIRAYDELGLMIPGKTPIYKFQTNRHGYDKMLAEIMCKAARFSLTEDTVYLEEVLQMVITFVSLVGLDLSYVLKENIICLQKRNETGTIKSTHRDKVS